MEMTHFHGINSTYSFSAVKAEMSAVQKQVQISQTHFKQSKSCHIRLALQQLDSHTGNHTNKHIYNIKYVIGSYTESLPDHEF